jgi:hypothetical protein
VRVLEPSEEQLEQLRPIMKKYAEMHRSSMASFHAGQQEMFEQFKSEIEVYLTQEQLKRLDEVQQRRMERRRPPPERFPRGRRPR